MVGGRNPADVPAVACGDQRKQADRCVFCCVKCSRQVGWQLLAAGHRLR